MPAFGTPWHITLSVSDAEASAQWYCEVLALQRLPRADLDNRNVGLDHIGFSIAGRADLDAWQRELADRGVVHSPAEDTANGAALVFRDPDNIQLEFWWTRP